MSKKNNKKNVRTNMINKHFIDWGGAISSWIEKWIWN